MSRGTTLQRMEEDVTQSKTAVNANAAAGDMALPKEGSNPSGVSTPGNTPPFEDLGGPTPENYKVDNDSAKLKTPGGSLKQVHDVVNKNAKPGDQAMPTAKKFKEEEEVSGDVVAEDETEQEEDAGHVSCSAAHRGWRRGHRPAGWGGRPDRGLECACCHWRHRLPNCMRASRLRLVRVRSLRRQLPIPES